MSSDALSQGIQAALGTLRQRRKPSDHDISQEANDALVVLEANMEGMAQIRIPPDSERHRVTFQLLRASMDYGRALLFLLKTHPVDLPAVALGLHRSQTEQFLRAVFIQFIADEEQLQDFLYEDRGPRRKNGKSKWAAIPFKDLAAEVETTIARIGQDNSPQKLARTVTNSWDPLCGLIHGGKAIRVMYEDPNGKIGAHVPAAILFQTTINTVATTNLCVIAALTATGVGAYDLNDVVAHAASHMGRYLEQRKSRVVHLAL